MNEKLRLRHIVGIFLAVVFAAILATLPSYVSVFDAFSIEKVDSATAAAFFVFVLAFLMNNAIVKNRQLRENMNIELSRLRRIHHLSQRMGKSAVDKRYMKKVDVALNEYFSLLGTQGMRAYYASRAPFRAITATIYDYTPKTIKSQILYGELMHVTREVAVTRQLISSQLQRGISSYGWVVLVSIEAIVILSNLIAQDGTLAGFAISMATIATILIVTLLIWEVDYISRAEMKEYGERYGKNALGIEDKKKKVK
jgi:hypothetical protein